MKNHSPNSKLPAARTAGTLAASQPKEADGSSILNEKRTWEIVLPDLAISAK